jgi:hypothetical protein
LKSRLEYPRHLKGAVLETAKDEAINLKSPSIPAGMWLKDVVFMQCGPYALIRQDFIYQLPSLGKSLGWPEMLPTAKIIRATTHKASIPLEYLYLPDSLPLTSDEWIELP